MNDGRLWQIRSLADDADRIAAELMDELDWPAMEPEERRHLRIMRGYLRRVHNKTKQLERLP